MKKVRKILFYVVAILFLSFSMPFINFDVSYANYLTIVKNDIKSFNLYYSEPTRYVRQYGYVRQASRDLKFSEIRQLERDIKGFGTKYLLGSSSGVYYINHPTDVEEYGFELYPNYINDSGEEGVVVSDVYVKEEYEIGNIDGMKDYYENDTELFKDVINKKIHSLRIIGIYKRPNYIDYNYSESLRFMCTNNVSFGGPISASGGDPCAKSTITLKTGTKEIEIKTIGSTCYDDSLDSDIYIPGISNTNLPITGFTMSKYTFNELFGVDINDYIVYTDNGQQIVEIPEQFFYDYELTITYDGHLYPDDNLDNILYPFKSNMNMVLYGVYDEYSGYGNSIRFSDKIYPTIGELLSGGHKLYAIDSFDDLNYVLHQLYDLNIMPSCHNALISIVKAEHSYFFYLISFGIFIGLVVLGIIIKYRKNIVDNIKNYKECLLPNIIKIIIYTLSLTIIMSLIALVFCIVVTICYNNMFVPFRGLTGIDPYAYVLPFSLTNILYFFIEGLLGSTLYFLVKNNKREN